MDIVGVPQHTRTLCGRYRVTRNGQVGVLTLEITLQSSSSTQREPYFAQIPTFIVVQQKFGLVEATENMERR
jgi:hypothetical protein